MKREIKEIKLEKMSRKDLLQILMNQNQKIDELTKELEVTKKKLEDKKIMIKECGSLAEASLRINEVFEKAEQAANQYLENIKLLNKKETNKSTKKTKKGSKSVRNKK